MQIDVALQQVLVLWCKIGTIQIFQARHGFLPVPATLGGALGAAYVFSALVLVSQIGAGSVAAATVTGQLTTSVILDRIGFLGLEQTPFSASRVAGVALLLAGTYLVVR